jgi:hypothetical protein
VLVDVVADRTLISGESFGGLEDISQRNSRDEFLPVGGSRRNPESGGRWIINWDGIAEVLTSKATA